MAGDYVMEERIESMVSPTGGNECRRTALFLKPSVASVDGPAAAPSLGSLSLSTDGVGKFSSLPFKANFVGWKRPTEEWKKWVSEMSSSHRSTWETAGILEAIMSSTVTVYRHRDLFFGFLEKWCPTTNSFVFPWGEATVTLEDMAVLGGYSVLGESVLSPPEDEEMQKVVKKLESARSYLSRTTKAKKPQQGAWMKKFSGSQREIEHEAFLAYWLSRFVFPSGMGIIVKHVLSIATRLARGTRIAIAPAVLASIYKSLSSLKAGVVAARKSGAAKEGSDSGPVDVVEVPVLAPLELVQVWIWERFLTLRPSPKPIGLNEPRLARWDGLMTLRIGNLSLVMDPPATEFLWRPYTAYIENGFPRRIYKDVGCWALIDSKLDEDLEEFIRWVRTSELVGLEEYCIEQYLPHRVAMQFGMDQDIPDHVARVDVNPQVAWSDYIRPVRDIQLYIPSSLSKPQCTTRYLNWWKKLYQGWCKEPGIGGMGTSEVSEEEEMKNVVGVKLEKDDLPPPPGFLPKRKTVVVPVKSNNSVAQEISPRSPLSSPSSRSVAKPGTCEKTISSMCLKRKLFDSSYENSKTSDYYTPVSPPFFALKRNCTENLGTTATKETVAELSSIESCHENNPGKDNLSSSGDNVNVHNVVVEPAGFEAEDTEAKGASGAMNVQDVKRIIDRLNQVPSSPFLLPGWIQQFTEKIDTLEKLAAWLNKGGELTWL